MFVILLLESSADYPSVSLLNSEGEEVWFDNSTEQRTHAEKLPVFTQRAIEVLQKNQQKLTAVAINKGPGSYTGLRIATSLAKGLCFGYDIPLIGVDGLKGMTNYLLDTNPELDVAVAMLDARRDEVYAVIQHKGKPTGRVESVIIKAGQWSELSENIGFIGNATEKAIRLSGCSPLKVENGPDVRQWSTLANRLFQEKKFESLAYFEPFYLKAYTPGVSQKFKL